MSVLDFPSSPTNGQFYSGYIWNEANSTWDSSFAPRAATIPISSPNYVINGGMDIAQRGTKTVTSDDQYGALDRWRTRTAGVGGSVTSTQVASGLTGVSANAFRFQRVSGNTNTSNLQAIHTLETSMSTPLAGKTVTLSFYARKGANFSPSNSGFSTYLRYGTGTDQYWGTGTWTNVISATTTLTSSWQRFTYTGTVSSAATQLYIMFDITPTGTAGAADYFEFTGVQLEDGAAPTEFRRNASNIQGELAACQRYFVRWDGAGTRPRLSTGMQSGTAVSWFSLGLPVQMRRVPVNSDVSWSGVFVTDNAIFDQNLNTLTISSGQACTLLSLTFSAGHNNQGAQFRPIQLALTETGFLSINTEL